MSTGADLDGREARETGPSKGSAASTSSLVHGRRVDGNAPARTLLPNSARHDELTWESTLVGVDPFMPHPNHGAYDVEDAPENPRGFCDLLPGNCDRRRPRHGLGFAHERRLRSSEHLPQDVSIRGRGRAR